MIIEEFIFKCKMCEIFSFQSKEIDINMQYTHCYIKRKMYVIKSNYLRNYTIIIIMQSGNLNYHKTMRDEN